MARLYTRTDAGRKAWDTQNGLVALDCRRVLGLLGQDTDPRDLRAKLGWSESAVNEILEELEQGGLAESIEAAPSSDLDFTGSFSADELRAAGEKK